ncbi:HAMP domain-containing sensor histidine kinase [Poseidonocella sp. HB161398]|uniref:sensor histidine kinase n=1 Tax=Poseidonocella sp. HB161398 TaxID=2320855 RepID=UPI001F105D65|nr:sensor histidine kinase [Poseidonocella sp. HB161398]
MRPLLRGLLAEPLREPPLSRAEIAFEDRLAEGDPARVPCDPVSLREALRNLLGNACNHGPPGTGIVVALDAAPGGGTTLSVEDDGPGIPGHRRPQLLERFASAGVGRGSGLGLAIVAEVARAHGARLRLEDSAAVGLAVRLDFPPTPDPGPRLPWRAWRWGWPRGWQGWPHRPGRAPPRP